MIGKLTYMLILTAVYTLNVDAAVHRALIFGLGKRPKNIGREHMIAVPDAFFKVVISLSGNTPKGIGFYYQNSEKRQTMESASRTIDQIEEMTGYDFFPELPDSVEDDVESQNNLTLWR